MTSCSISALILTHNEEHHIARCITNLRGVVEDIYIVDSFSSDRTVQVAESLGAKVYSNAWINYSKQFNWGLDNLPFSSDWILRIDADEYLSDDLIAEIKIKFPSLGREVVGVYFGRRMVFQGKLIRHGGVFPVKVLRLFRNRHGRCEDRWMDEHIKVDGPVTHFKGELIDENINSLTWWTEKHNKYASREAVDLLNLEYGFMPHDTVASLRGGSQAGFKRWLKERVYVSLPTGFRAFAYFFYRYFIRFGFLDGQEGFSFNFLQGFWYRYLVDAKVVEVKRHMRVNSVSAPTAISRVLGIDV